MSTDPITTLLAQLDTEDLHTPWTGDDGLFQRSAAAIRRLREALAYYAAPDHYDYGDAPGHIYVIDDCGALARETLGLPRQIQTDQRFDIELKCRRIMMGDF